MNPKLFKVLVVSGVVFAGAAIYKIHNLAKTTLQNDFPKKPFLNEELKRIPIFKTGFLTTKHLKILFDYSNIEENAEVTINKEKVASSLKPLIREQLQELFRKEGWNFDELKGKVFYEIQDKRVEVYVVWKNNPYSQNYTNFDRFSISL